MAVGEAKPGEAKPTAMALDLGVPWRPIRLSMPMECLWSSFHSGFATLMSEVKALEKTPWTSQLSVNLPEPHGDIAFSQYIMLLYFFCIFLVYINFIYILHNIYI